MFHEIAQLFLRYRPGEVLIYRLEYKSDNGDFLVLPKNLYTEP